MDIHPLCLPEGYLAFLNSRVGLVGRISMQAFGGAIFYSL